MKLKRTAATCLTIAAFSLNPLSVSAQDYDFGSGDGFFDEGAGFENGYTGPGLFKMAFGAAGAVALIVGALAIANDETDSSSSSHSSSH